MKKGVGIAIGVCLVAVVAVVGIYLLPQNTAAGLNPSNIVVSDTESRHFKTLTLKNGLKVALVSDPGSDKAAAAMNVFVGSWENPTNLQGLAHFLEHMLFLGTEKYPEADGYQQFIERNGGRDNAYTSSENTLYHFDINAPALPEALDRFAQFFIAPLFDPIYSDRERNAVHSEYSASLQNDGRRIEDAIREIVDKTHPASKLAVGNLETLASDNMSETLNQFYKAHYVSTRMALTVYGPQPIDQLEKLVEEYFKGIRNIESAAPIYGEPIIAAERLPLLVEVEPRSELRQLSFRFPTTNTVANITNRPENYVAHLLGHESTGSLLSILKEKGWAESLYAGSGGLTESMTTFNVTIELTPEGVQNWQEVGALLFAQIQLISEQGVQQWIFDEQQRINEIGFQFAEKVSASQTAVVLAERLRFYPAEQILSGPYRMEGYSPEQINQVLKQLQPDNALVILTHPNAETNLSSKYYQTPYSVGDLSGNLLATWRNPKPSVTLALPTENPFIPSQLDVLPLVNEASALFFANPQRIATSETTTVWFEQDDQFQTPKVDIHLLLETDFANQSAANRAATSLYLTLVNDALNEVRYEASLAGSGYGISLADNGILIRLYGYQDKLQLLLDTLTIELADHSIDADRFAIKREEYMRNLRNSDEEPVIRQVLRRANEWLVSNSVSVDEQMEAVTQLTLEDLIEARETWLTANHLTTFIHGNLTQVQALEWATRIDAIIPQEGAPKINRTVAKIPTRTFLNSIYIDHSDSAFLQYYQGESSSLRERALYALLADMLSAPYFTELRTKEQLGYIVMARPYPIDDLPGLILYIQSPSTDPALLQLYSDRFLSQYRQRLQVLSDANFDDFKQGLKTNLLEEDKNLYQLSGRYWGDIQVGNKNFNSLTRIAHEVDLISLDGFRRFYENRVLADNVRSLSLHQIGKNMKSDYKDHMESIVGLYPLDSPKQWPNDIEWVSPTFNNN
ncbi:insulinase family protein [Reinekea sp.]|jgi:insulysin|uniref:insulinase family protein n=1 Tax=Reinekea sp. TaxID=1970455 RepID=UPI00398914A7